MTPRWRRGLVRIACVECGRDLDWAQPEFLERHPMPRCCMCGLYPERKAVYAGAGVATTDTSSAPAVPVQRRRWRWFR